MSEPLPGPVIVTGGSRGIGAAIVRRCAEMGVPVTFTFASDEAAATNFAEELRTEGFSVLALKADVAVVGSAVEVFDAAERAFGPVAALVNNAGVTGQLGPFVEVGDADLRRVVEVNLVGTMLYAREALRRWRGRNQAGLMVNISSIASVTGSPGEYVHYAASKAAIEAFTLGLAREEASTGTRVNAVSPGTCLTDIHAKAGDPHRPQRIAARVPLGRAGEPTEIAAAVAWLLSAEASYVTGAVLKVAGGL